LNDSTYLVAAVALAKKMADYDKKLGNQITYGFETAIGQPITLEKRKILEQLYQTAMNDFSKKLIKKEVNKSTAALLDQPPNVAALAVVASAILNLDEFVNKS